jgi:hypothetical protein
MLHHSLEIGENEPGAAFGRAHALPRKVPESMSAPQVTGLEVHHRAGRNPNGVTTFT